MPMPPWWHRAIAISDDPKAAFKTFTTKVEANWLQPPDKGAKHPTRTSVLQLLDEIQLGELNTAAGLTMSYLNTSIRSNTGSCSESWMHATKPKIPALGLCARSWRTLRTMKIVKPFRWNVESERWRERQQRNSIHSTLRMIHCQVLIFARLVSSQITKLSSSPTSWSKLATGRTISIRSFSRKLGLQCQACLVYGTRP